MTGPRAANKPRTSKFVRLDPNQIIVDKEEWAVLRDLRREMVKANIRPEKILAETAMAEEAQRAFAMLTDGKAREAYQWKPEDQEKALELVQMVTDAALQKVYPTWESRRDKLGWSEKKLTVIRETKEYVLLLKQAIASMALHGVAAAIPAQIAVASDPSIKGAPLAFKNLGLAAGVFGAGPTGNTFNVTQNNITIEQGLRALVAKALPVAKEVVDVKVIP